MLELVIANRRHLYYFLFLWYVIFSYISVPLRQGLVLILRLYPYLSSNSIIKKLIP